MLQDTYGLCDYVIASVCLRILDYDLGFIEKVLFSSTINFKKNCTHTKTELNDGTTDGLWQRPRKRTQTISPSRFQSQQAAVAKPLACYARYNHLKKVDKRLLQMKLTGEFAFIINKCECIPMRLT